MGRSFNLFGAPMPSGGYVVSAIETTGLLAARAEAERIASHTRAALATLRTGLAAFGPDRRLLFANASFAELISLPIGFAEAGVGFTAMLAAMAERDEYSGADGVAFLAEQLAANRALPGSTRPLTAGRGRSST